jgi:hypothetical protein
LRIGGAQAAQAQPATIAAAYPFHGSTHPEDIVKSVQRNLLRIAACAAVFGTGLGGCGGDGGGDAPAPESEGTVALTTVNRDTAARVAATSVIGLSVSTAIPYGTDGDGVAAQVAAPTSLGAARLGMASWLPTRLLDAVTSAAASQARASRSGLARPQEVVVAPTEACVISGTVSLSLNDHDNDGLLGVGDVMTISFDHCQDGAAYILDGSIATTFTSIGTGVLPTFGARMVFVQLSQEATNGRHGLMLDGAAVLDYAQVSDTAERMKMTADGNVVSTVRTHLPFNDTVTLNSGFFQDTSYDANTGLATTTMTGSVQSRVLGGTVVVSTVTPIQVLDGDGYPRSGTVKTVGSTGEVRLTPLSASQVRIELDADQNGSFESSDTQTWDWLI